MLFEVVTIDLHYMTDRQQRFDLKISKSDIYSRPLFIVWNRLKPFEQFAQKLSFGP